MRAEQRKAWCRDGVAGGDTGRGVESQGKCKVSKHSTGRGLREPIVGAAAAWEEVLIDT